MKQLLIALLRVYQWVFRPMLGPRCRFFPSCSDYAISALGRYGALKGGWLSGARLSKCHPWHPGGIDPVPEQTFPSPRR